MKRRPSTSLLPALLMIAVSLSGYGTSALAADNLLTPPADPRQSINYWKAHSIDAAADPQVKKAEDIFATLLRGWDSSRLEPGLTVVDSASGAWAASLADGNILLSRQAIDTCMHFGAQRGEHLLAFVLAHELAHQRADDLWHQRFFRMIGEHNPESRRKMLHGMQLDTNTLPDLEQKEAQADHDGLILMASVGYDPYRILDGDRDKQQDFFTAWVENIWRDSCNDQNNTAIQDACRQAQARALRTRAQLQTVASQALVYELGVQAFVAGDYTQARQYFTAFGRDYPSRAVLSAIGLSYLAEAQEVHNRLLDLGAVKTPRFYYPLMLDAHADAQPVDDNATQTRGDASLIKQLQQQKHAVLEQAVHLFEKALRLEPGQRKTYLLLASAHLLDGNTYMVRGVLQGSYTPRFGDDAALDMMLALTSALEGDTATAEKDLDRLISKPRVSTAMPDNLLSYSLYFNRAALAALKHDDTKTKQLWKQLAGRAKSDGNALLFRMALAQLVTQNGNTQAIDRAPSVDGKRIGDRVMTDSKPLDELWIEGEPYRVYRAADGGRYITAADKQIVSAWQDNSGDSLAGLLTVGDSADRPFKTLGMPDRRIDMQSGEYLAYDRYGVALHINDGRVSGWFLYNRRGRAN